MPPFHLKNTGAAGFTLIELLVVMSISMLIMTGVLANYNRYRSATVLSNLAYSVALGVREAQVYGLSFRSGVSAQSYGIYFATNPGTSFVIFADTANNDKFYTAGQDSITKTYTISENPLFTLCPMFRML